MPDYQKNPPLLESDLHADPLAQLEGWLTQAREAGLIEPTAMTLATIGADGRPAARIVLFKGLVDGGLSFFTNYESRKGAELAANPNVALVFWWDRLERSVRVEGSVAKLAAPLSEQYFHARPRGSQLGALTSRQSRVVASRAELEQRLAANERQCAGQDVPHPAFWGGYRVEPLRFEFWQGRRDRLHDRLVYRLADGLVDGRAAHRWTIERLEP